MLLNAHQILPSSAAVLVKSGKKFIKTMIKSRMSKIRSRLSAQANSDKKLLQAELERLERRRDRAYALHLDMLRQTEELLFPGSRQQRCNNDQDDDDQNDWNEQRQLKVSPVDDAESCCCCCCCCYGCDLDLVRGLETEPVYYDQNLANENLENDLQLCC